MSNYMQSKQNCIHSLLLQVDRHSSQKISKDIVELNIINQLEIIDNRLFQSTRTEHTFFLSSHGAFTKIDHILGHKTHLNKFRREKIQCLLSDYNRIKLEIYNKMLV